MIHAGNSTGFGLALVAALLLGLRHGSDYDHIAAITDLGSAERQPWRAMRLGLLYAVGHAITVLLLGVLVILFRVSLPARLDDWTQPIVGVTLLVLGIYVLQTSFFGEEHGHTHVRSRFLLLADGVLWCIWRVRRALGDDSAERRRVSLQGISPRTTVLVGVIHGIGAETPSQLMLFLIAANLGGICKGLLGLGTFIVGLFVMNAVICAVTAGLLRLSVDRKPRMQLVAGASAAYSIVLGAIFLIGPWLH
jgi:high-affinity nickel-transport protein